MASGRIGVLLHPRDADGRMQVASRSGKPPARRRGARCGGSGGVDQCEVGSSRSGLVA